MTSAEIKNAYYALLKNGYSLNLRELYKLAHQAYKDTPNTELNDISIDYTIFYLLYFVVIVMPISIFLWRLFSWLSHLTSEQQDILVFPIIIGITHIYTLYASLRAHRQLRPTKNWNGEFRNKNSGWIFSGIVPISILYGILSFFLIYATTEIWHLLQKNTASPLLIIVQHLGILAFAIYGLVSTRLALPIMLYSRIQIWEATFLSVGIITRKFFHFLLIEIGYLIVILLGIAAFVIGLMFSVEYIKVIRSFIVHFLVNNDEKIIDVSEEIDELIEQIGDN
jgi:hypothetical protein